jgi:hypothetical protein
MPNTPGKLCFRIRIDAAASQPMWPRAEQDQMRLFGAILRLPNDLPIPRFKCGLTPMVQTETDIYFMNRTHL